MSDALVHITPYDGFAFGNSRTNDLCLRTQSAQQRVMVSPAKADDTDVATLTVGHTEVEVAGNLLAAGSVVSSDVGTAGLRLRKPAASDAAAASHVWNEPVRLRIGTATSAMLNPRLYDVVLIRPSDSPPLPDSYALISGPSVNGRRFVVKNTTSDTAVVVNVLSADALSTLRAVEVPPGGDVSFFGHLDQWF